MPRFVHPEVGFSCTRCGDCCRGWDVMLVGDEPGRIEALRWEGRAPDLAGLQATAPVRVAGVAGRRQLARRRDGSCVFLGEANQCRIHEHFGEAAKPLLCRLYPFAFHPLGDRVGVDVSFFCRSVSRGDGAPLEGRIPEWTRLLAEWGGGAGHPVFLTHEHALPPALAWEIEEQIVALLVTPGAPLFDRVRAVLEFMKLATTGDPTTPAAATMRAALAKGIPRQIAARPVESVMSRTQRNVFYQWLYVALNPAPADYDMLPADLKERAKREIAKAGDRFRRRKGNPAIDGRPMAVTFADVERVDASSLLAACPSLESFLVAKILGQKLLRAASEELPLVEAVPKLLLLYPMAIWTAKAMAAARGDAVAGEGDVRGALRLLDRSFGAIATALLPRVQADAFEWVMLETELVESAASELTSAS